MDNRTGGDFIEKKEKEKKTEEAEYWVGNNDEEEETKVNQEKSEDTRERREIPTLDFKVYWSEEGKGSSIHTMKKG